MSLELIPVTVIAEIKQGEPAVGGELGRKSSTSGTTDGVEG